MRPTTAGNVTVAPMAIKYDTAARIALEHGLTAADAATIRDLADDTDHAQRLAARFAQTDMQRLTADLFADQFGLNDN